MAKLHCPYCTMELKPSTTMYDPDPWIDFLYCEECSKHFTRDARINCISEFCGKVFLEDI